MKSIYIDQQKRFLPYLTSKQVKELPDKEKAVIVLPVASIEQHGPHLPVYTDSLINQAVLSQAFSLLPEDFPIWFLPLLPYGKSNEHAGLAGTFTLTSETFIQVLKEIARNVARNGFKRLAIVNTHGGNAEIVDFVIRDIREETDLYVFGLQVGLRIGTNVEGLGLSDDEKVFGIHASDIETSVLLHICPELVHMDVAPDGTPLHLKELNTPPFMGPLNFAWLTRDISRTGVLGNAQTANAAKGAEFGSRAARELAGIFKQIAAFEFKP